MLLQGVENGLQWHLRRQSKQSSSLSTMYLYRFSVSTGNRLSDLGGFRHDLTDILALFGLHKHATRDANDLPLLNQT